MAKLRMLFLIFGILLVIFGVLCFGCANYLSSVEDDLEEKWYSGVEMGSKRMSHDEFMDYADENIPKLNGAEIVSECAAVGNFVLFGIGESKLKKSKKSE